MNQNLPFSATPHVPLPKLKNLGNTCYINASIQMLLSLNVHASNPDLSLIENDPNKKCATEFLAIANAPTGIDIDTAEMNRSLLDVAPIAPGEQNDANVILDALITNQYLFERGNLMPHWATVTTCTVCSQESPSFEYVAYLSFHLSQNDTLQNIIDIQCRQILLNDKYNCSDCGYQVATQRQCLKGPAPKNLIILLIRLDQQTGLKNNFSLNLGDQKIKVPLRTEDAAELYSSISYTLQSTISHTGETEDAGHFIAHVKNEGKWYRCDDAHVTQCSKSDIPLRQVTYLAFKQNDDTHQQFEEQAVAQASVELQEAAPGPSDRIPNVGLEAVPIPYNRIPTVINLLSNSLLMIPSNVNLAHKVSLYHGDITTIRNPFLSSDCIVNAAKPSLLGGGGVDGAIHSKAGSALKEHCGKLGGCQVGKAKLTPGFLIKAQIIHTVGPQNQNPDKLQSCYRECLKIVEDPKHNIRTIAFPCIATKIYKFPNFDAAHIALSVVREWLEGNSSKIDKIIFCTFEPDDQKLYKELITKYFPDFVNC